MKHPSVLIAVAVILITTGVPIAAKVDLLSTEAFKHVSATSTLLLDIDKNDRQILTVGEFGTILSSSDDGNTWQQRTAPTSVTLTAVKLINNNDVIAVGHDGLILRSDDEGKSWRKILDGHAINTLNLAASKQQLQNLVSTESSSTQNEQLQFEIEELEYTLEIIQDDIQQGPSTPLLDIAFSDHLQGFAIGAYGLLLQTQDGGLNWKIISERLPNPDGLHLNAITVTTAGVLFIVGESGIVFRSTDNGLSWINLSVPYEGSLFGVIETSSKQQAVLLTFGLRGHVFRSVDNGTNWQAITTDTTETLSNSVILPDGRLAICGNSGVILISNAGISQFETHWRDDGLSSSSIVSDNSNKLILVGRNGLKHLSLDKLH